MKKKRLSVRLSGKLLPRLSLKRFPPHPKKSWLPVVVLGFTILALLGISLWASQFVLGTSNGLETSTGSNVVGEAFTTVFVARNVVSCSDTETGVNIYQAAKVTYRKSIIDGWSVLPDKCFNMLDQNLVMDYYCEKTGRGNTYNVKILYFNCKNQGRICKEGICVRSD